MAEQKMTIDELAKASGVTSRTIRSYQDRGLLPSPQIIGRTGYYEPSHLARLRMIGRLLDQRFSLAAIGALFDAWESGQSLAEILGSVEELAPYAAETSTQMTREEMQKMFAVRDAVWLRRAEQLGVLRPRQGPEGGNAGSEGNEGNEAPEGPDANNANNANHEIPPEISGATSDELYDVLSPVLLETGAKLLRAGVPVERLLEEAERLREDCDAIAGRFVDLFSTYIWKPFSEAGRPAAELQRVVDYLAITRPLPVQATSVMIAQAMQRRLEQSYADVIGGLDAPDAAPAEVEIDLDASTRVSS